jgi:hypothetical protein
MKLLVVLLLLLFSTSAAAQNLYKWKDDKGQWRLSTTPPEGRESDTLALKDPVGTLPKEPPCASFKPGETRNATSYYRGVNTPLEMVDMQLKRLDGDPGAGYFSWKVVVQNFSSFPVVAGGTVVLKDCSEFLIADATLPAMSLPPFATVTLDGTKVIGGPPTEKVGRFSVYLGDTAGADR